MGNKDNKSKNYKVIVIFSIIALFCLFCVCFANESTKKECTGIGGYNIGVVLETNISYDELKNNDYWVKIQNIKPVGIFDQWAEIRITPLSHTICRIKLIGPIIKENEQTILGPNSETLRSTIGAIEKFYGIKPSGADSLRLIFDNGINLVTGYETNNLFNQLNTEHKKRIANRYFLYCSNIDYQDTFNKEMHQIESKQEKDINLIGLN